MVGVDPLASQREGVRSEEAGLRKSQRAEKRHRPRDSVLGLPPAATQFRLRLLETLGFEGSLLGIPPPRVVQESQEFPALPRPTAKR